jgi:uncharacterized membrane protein
MKPIKIVFILLTIPLLVLDVALFLNGKIQVKAAVAMLATFAAIIILYYFLFLRRGGEKVEKDERTIKLNSRASVYSWLITIYVVVLLMGLDTLGLLRLTGVQDLTIVAMTMSFSYLILLFFISRKGDIE